MSLPKSKSLIILTPLLALGFITGCGDGDSAATEPVDSFVSAAAEIDPTENQQEIFTNTASTLPGIPTTTEVPVDGESESTTAVDEVDQTSAPANNTPLVIFDTDMGPDIDDALALAMLHAYADQGKIELAAVTISRNGPNGAKFADALNTFYGRPDIPVGLYRGPTATNADMFSVLAASYSHDLDGSSIKDGYVIQREVLASALENNREVIFIQVGFSGNLSQLMNSQGDQVSDLPGIELVKQNDSLLSIMAGHFNVNQPEFNIEKDLSSALNLFSKWPTQMAVSDWAVGGNIHFPYSAIQNLPTDHPIRAAYEHTDLHWHQDAPPYYNMKSWDLTSVIEAVEPGADYFNRSQTGTVSLNGTGVSTFNQGSGSHYILTNGNQLSDGERTAIINRMVELVK